jgi:hypothetical protein
MPSIEQPNPSARIRFYMTGPALEKDIPLHLMLATLQDFQSILDKTFLGLIGRKRMSKEERHRFELRTQGIKSGSLDSFIDIVLNGSQSFLPLVMIAGPLDIFEYAKSSFEFLKATFEKFKHHDPPTYSAGGNDSTMLVDNSVTNFNGPIVLSIAKEVLPYFQNMAQSIKNEGVESIIFGNNTSAITLGIHEKEIFDLPTVIDRTQLTFNCNIIDFNKIKRAGRLIIGKSESSPAGEYRFGVVGNQELDLYIQALGHSVVTVIAVRELRLDPFDSKIMKIAGFQIIGMKLPDQKFKT